MLNNLIILLFAYSLSKMGYLVLFNNLFHLLALKGQKNKDNWLDRFSKVLGYTLVTSGLITALLLFIKKYFPDNYLSFYGIYLLLALAFLLYKFFTLRKKASQGLI